MDCKINIRIYRLSDRKLMLCLLYWNFKYYNLIDYYGYYGC